VFDPSRFLPDAASIIDRFAFLPFGVGPRMRLGATFAVREATLVLAALARDFELLVAGLSVWPIVDFTMKPRDGLHWTSERHARRLRCALQNRSRPSPARSWRPNDPGELPGRAVVA